MQFSLDSRVTFRQHSAVLEEGLDEKDERGVALRPRGQFLGAFSANAVQAQ